MSVRHKLGGRYIRRGETTSMFRELKGKSGDVAEGLDCALEGYEKFLDVEGTWRRGANTRLRQERFWAT